MGAEPTAEVVSRNAAGAVAEGTLPRFSADGRLVAFESSDPLIASDTNGASDVYLRDRVSNSIERISVRVAGASSGFFFHVSAVSPDGRFVLFSTENSNLVSGDTRFPPRAIGLGF